MRAVITGATSFVGAATVKEMLKRGHEVIAVVRPKTTKLDRIMPPDGSNAESGSLTVVENDLSTPELLPEKIPVSCDVFCHFGWGGSGSDARTNRALQEKNLEDSLNTIRAAKALGCTRFLFSGSQAEYGLHRTRITEETPCSPRSFYGEAKLGMRHEGEALCKALGITYIHARIFSAYGPGDHPWTLAESCLSAFTGGQAISLGQCTQQWNFIYIDDLAHALCALAELPGPILASAIQGSPGATPNPVFNLAGAETKPLRDFVTEIHALCGFKGTPAYATRQENAEGIIHLTPDITKLQATLNWTPPTSFQTGIQKLLATRKNHNNS